MAIEIVKSFAVNKPEKRPGGTVKKVFYQVDNDEEEFSLLLSLLVLLEAPDEVRDLDDGGHQHDGRVPLALGNFAEQNILKPLLRAGQPVIII